MSWKAKTKGFARWSERFVVSLLDLTASDLLRLLSKDDAIGIEPIGVEEVVWWRELRCLRHASWCQFARVIGTLVRREARVGAIPSQCTDVRKRPRFEERINESTESCVAFESRVLFLDICGRVISCLFLCVKIFDDSFSVIVGTR